MSIFEASNQTDDSGRAFLRVVGELDLATAPTLLEAAGAVTDIDPLRIDLSEVTFLDSTGLGAIITIRNDVRERGGKFAILSISRSVERVLKLSGLDEELLNG